MAIAGASHPTGPAAPEPAGRQARRKAETRQRLLGAARDLFARRGYDATRPQDIARAADVAAGTFYLHFADKREAYLAFTDLAAEELMGVIRERMAGALRFEDRLRRSLEGLFDFAESHPGVLSAAFADAVVIAADVPSGASLRDRLADSLAQGLAHGMEHGELANAYDPRIIAHGIVGMIGAACVHGARHASSTDELIDNLTRFCARALAPTADVPTESPKS